MLFPPYYEIPLMGTLCLPQDIAGGSGNNQDDSGSGNNHESDPMVIVNLKLDTLCLVSNNNYYYIICVNS